MNNLESICRPVFGHGWQSKLARYAGVNPRTVRRWITGEITLPDWMEPLLDRLAPSLPDRFIIGVGASGNEYIVHTHFPRFICQIGRESWISGITYKTKDGKLLHSFVWLDKCPESTSTETVLMRNLTLSGILNLIDDELKYHESR